ncbi:uncharacterized protein PHACADRAFT_249130 [Phanerochaete carnosa HHB-10118-sp]|uniref:Phytocyanin domain-containing protein n=1 Tax=Phanerochaete carnosa (strain HHB-10118-sp) TaxID=650164 RepID=K5X7Z2_PHACS|nr:uncharacterized protein PHACADRAFT_249130 [Phanerochaete carnosa HHB-10118-sp]EKM58982.1 hypothetical protein PHACADRAFT_249130 [Phanerochaete carnosa HHB-10118-sp]
MHTSAAVAVLLSAALVAVAQTVVTIQVGAEAATPGGIYQYMPPNVTASNGTIVNFVWQGSPGNHTITQSTAQSPCQPMSSGFDSGFLFIPANTTSNFPSWNLTITNDQEPIYFYCAQLIPGPHCSTFGMVGSINAPASGTGSWDDVVSTALASNGTTPGEPTPGASLVGVDVNVTAPPGPVGTSTDGIQGFDLPAATPSPAASSNASGSGASTAGSTAGPSGSTTGGAPAPTGGSSGAAVNVASGAALIFSALLGTLLL